MAVRGESGYLKGEHEDETLDILRLIPIQVGIHPSEAPNEAVIRVEE